MISGPGLTSRRKHRNTGGGVLLKPLPKRRSAYTDLTHTHTQAKISIATPHARHRLRHKSAGNDVGGQTR